MSQTKLSPEVLDALKAVSDRHHASHERRASHELQVVITSLSFFGATVALRLSSSFDTSSPIFLPCIITAILGLCITATTYLVSSARSNTFDLEKAKAADRDIIASLNQDCCPAIKTCIKSSGTTRPSPSRNRWLWQIAIVWSGGALSSVMVVWGR